MHIYVGLFQFVFAESLKIKSTESSVYSLWRQKGWENLKCKKIFFASVFLFIYGSLITYVQFPATIKFFYSLVYCDILSLFKFMHEIFYAIRLHSDFASKNNAPDFVTIGRWSKRKNVQNIHNIRSTGKVDSSIGNSIPFLFFRKPLWADANNFT